MSHRFKSVPVRSFEITPRDVYLSRRDFIKAAGVIAGSMALAACAPHISENTSPTQVLSIPVTSNDKDELGDPLNSYQDITNYNNYYEFTTDKEYVAPLSANFKTVPWDVQVYGLVNKPQNFQR